MDDCSDDDMAALASTRCLRSAMPAVPLSAHREDWTLERLRGRPLPDAEAIVYVLAFARRHTFYVDVAKDIGDAIAVKYRIDRAQRRQSGKRGVTPLYCVYIECHASEDAARQCCAAIKALPHAWQRCIIDRFNPAWLSMANELIAFPCSRDAIGEDGVVMLPECEQAAAPTPGRWWIPPLSAGERANAIWSRPSHPLEPGAPTPV
jgi:predicted GIY-YIG superfamily endonuclease